MSTKEIKEQLDTEGVPLPTDEEVTRISAMFNGKLTTAMQGKTGTWYTLFKEVDDDASG